MAYVRKTKDIYKLIWNNEVIDSFDSIDEARRMRREYALAFHCSLWNIMIKTGRERIGA